jgi:hypothetical protein
MTENELFDLKQTLISKPILLATALPKLKKIRFQSELRFNELSISSHPFEWWNSYVSWKNDWKLNVFKAKSSSVLSTLIQEALSVELQFVTPFAILSFEDFLDETPVFGKEPDPMCMHEGFLLLNKSGISEINEIETFVKNNLSLFNLQFVLGLKRLSLLTKYLKDESRSF